MSNLPIFTMLRYSLLIALLLLAFDVVAQDSIPVLNSKEGAALTIYLDFNGHFTKNTLWNLGQRNDQGGWARNPIEIIETPAFDRVDLIQNIWARVAEDYAPFNVNVTTFLPNESPTGFEDSLTRTDSNDVTYGVRAAIGNNSAWYGNAGGVAYIDTFDKTYNSYRGPAFVFTNNLDSEKSIAEAISHEVGHNLGLYHDGIPGGGDNEYYKGANGWAPIMGNSYNENAVSQWDNGKNYADATNYLGGEVQPTLQDDLSILDKKLTYRKDDFGDGLMSGAEMLTGKHLVEDSTNTNPYTKFFRVEGIIEQDTDVDMFQFTLGEGGDFSFSVDSAIWHKADNAANLDVLAKLYYDNPKTESLFEWDPTGTMGIAEVTSLHDLLLLESIDFLAGTYFLSLEGTGLLNAYSDYASIGTYLLSGWIQEGTLSGAPVPEPATLAILGLGFTSLALARRRK